MIDTWWFDLIWNHCLPWTDRNTLIYFSCELHTFLKMISAESLKLLVWSFRLLSAIRCVPGYWDEKSKCILVFADSNKTKRDATTSLIIEIFVTCVHFSLMIFVLVQIYSYYIYDDIMPEEIVTGVFFLCILILSTAVYLSNFCLHFNSVVLHFNTLVRLNEKYGKNGNNIYFQFEAQRTAWYNPITWHAYPKMCNLCWFTVKYFDVHLKRDGLDRIFQLLFLVPSVVILLGAFNKFISIQHLIRLIIKVTKKLSTFDPQIP